MTNKEKVTSFAKNGYDDKPERKAFRKLIYRDESFKNWIKDYFQLNMEEGPFKIIEDPLGEYAVDLGMIDSAGTIVGLIEVDAEAKAKAARTAMLFSRVNTMLSIPMLVAMTVQQNLFS